MGDAIPRIEDERLLTGRGRYTDDINLPRQARAIIVRSVHAAAGIRGINTSVAKEAPGVIAVFTHADLASDGVRDLPCMAQLNRAGGAPMVKPPHPALASDAVHHVGDGIAMVVAESLAEAKDAAELVAIDYEPRAAVTDSSAAVAPGAPAVWPSCPDNICFEFELGDRAAVDRAFETASHVTSLDFTVNRVAPAPMEPRAALGVYDLGEERYTLYCGVQNPHGMRRMMAALILGIPETQLRVVSPDMGGGFGMRSNPYAEIALVLWAARRIGRPVKWTGERAEAFVADDQGRDNRTRVELALDPEGTFLALRVRTLAALGAYLSMGGPTPAVINLGGLAGVYTTPAIHASVRGVFVNTPSTAPYRGAGRPEASYAVERAIDTAAREMALDPIEMRRRNMIPPDALPYKTGLVFTYDTGDFERAMDLTLEAADRSGFAARRAEAHGRGMLLGFGVAAVIERAAAMGEEAAEIRFDPTGTVTLLVGTHSHGQGHETVFRQLLCGELGVPFDAVRFVQGDTDAVLHGTGTFGSRSSGLAGAAIVRCAAKIIDKGRHIAAHALEAAADDIEFADGRFIVAGTDRGLDLGEVCRLAYAPPSLPPGMEPGLIERAMYAPTAPTFPNGCHACEVEIDPETGATTLTRYAVIDDVGRVINPLLLEGQVHGALVQGLGQVMMEDMAWDAAGQPITGTFLDYAMPRAGDMPFFVVGSHDIPSTNNPLGIKGAGEAGTVGALPCVMNAIVDALAPLGVRTFDMPATPGRLWRAIQSAPGHPQESEQNNGE
jgi:carbon-monoxide dehydrogenase large subunit